MKTKLSKLFAGLTRKLTIAGLAVMCVAHTALEAYTSNTNQNWNVWDGSSASPVGTDWSRRWAVVGTSHSASYGFSAIWDSDGFSLGLKDWGPNRKDLHLNWGGDVEDEFHISFNGTDVMRMAHDKINANRPLVFSSSASISVAAITILPDEDPSRSRAGILAGGWLFGQDSEDDGVKDFFIRDVSTSRNALVITPDGRMDINGLIRAKEIVVEAVWADDVFDKNYKLASLQEVERHIEEQGHLPDVPSAREVAERGVAVGQMQSLLLRKIEELTLHVIALEKRVESQQAYIEQMGLNP